MTSAVKNLSKALGAGGTALTGVLGGLGIKNHMDEKANFARYNSLVSTLEDLRALKDMGVGLSDMDIGDYYDRNYWEYVFYWGLRNGRELDKPRSERSDRFKRGWRGLREWCVEGLSVSKYGLEEVKNRLAYTSGYSYDNCFLTKSSFDSKKWKEPKDMWDSTDSTKRKAMDLDYS